MFTSDMDNIGLLMTCSMFAYLEEELQKRFKLFKLWHYPSTHDFFKHNANSIRAVVGNTKIGADAELIDSLPKLEIVASYSVGLDKIDLRKCEEKGIRVTNTPDVLTDDVADIAIGLMLAVLRKICVCDGFVRSGSWKSGDFGLTSKVLFFISKTLFFSFNMFELFMLVSVFCKLFPVESKISWYCWVG